MAKAKEIEEALNDMAKSDIVSKNPEKMTVNDAVFAYAAITHLEKVLEKRKEKLKEVLTEHVEKHGSAVGEKGAVQVIVSGTKVVRERKTSKTPNEAKLKAMVLDKGLGIHEAFDEVIVMELNPSKVQYLVETGKLDSAEVDALHSVTFTMKVSPSGAVKDLLEQVAPVPAE